MTAGEIWSLFEATYLAPGRDDATGPADGGATVELLDSTQHAVGEGAATVVYVEARVGGAVRWGVGLDTDPAAAAREALRSAVARS